LFHFQVLLHHSIKGIRNEIHNHIQIYLIGFLAVGIKELAHFNTIRVVQGLQYFKLSVLIALMLEHFLNRDCLSRLGNSRLEDDTERTVTYNFLCIVSETLSHYDD